MPLEPVQYEDHDEAPHDPGPDPAWQESVFVHWYDPRVGVGGIHRIGHEVSAGITALWCGVVSRDGVRFRRSEAISYRPEDRLPDGFGAGPNHRLTFDPRPRTRGPVGAPPPVGHAALAPLGIGHVRAGAVVRLGGVARSRRQPAAGR